MCKHIWKKSSCYLVSSFFFPRGSLEGSCIVWEPGAYLSTWHLLLEEWLQDVNFWRTQIFLERREKPSFPWQWISRVLAVGWPCLSPPLSVKGRKSAISSLSTVCYCILRWNVLAVHICIGLFDLLNLPCSLKIMKLSTKIAFKASVPQNIFMVTVWRVLGILGKWMTE